LSEVITEDGQTIHLVAMPEGAQMQPEPQPQSQPQPQNQMPSNNPYAQIFEQAFSISEAFLSQLAGRMGQRSSARFPGSNVPPPDPSISNSAPQRPPEPHSYAQVGFYVTE
jgi:hypothetical protein